LIGDSRIERVLIQDAGWIGDQHPTARPYSLDLRERVVAAVLARANCRQVAAMYRFSVASVVKWAQRLRSTGSAAAKQMGGTQPRSLARERAWVLARLAAVPDLTLRALVVELGERGVVTSYGSVWRIVHDADISFKKNSVRHRAGSFRRGAKALAMESLSRPA
jgi:transposase